MLTTIDDWIIGRFHESSRRPTEVQVNEFGDLHFPLSFTNFVSIDAHAHNFTIAVITLCQLPSWILRHYISASVSSPHYDM